jgi:hypothetical protein
MTNQIQAVVEAMARHRWNLTHVTEWEALSTGVKKDLLAIEDIIFAVALARIDAIGWQIVPKVATKEMCRAWENSTSASVEFKNMTDNEINNIIASRDYAAMLAAAPKFGDA